jgi:hypothetical protein
VQARSELERALDLADHLGARRIANEACAELIAAGGKPRRDAITGRDALTAGELRVAGLAAQGLTNLGITRREQLASALVAVIGDSREVARAGTTAISYDPARQKIEPPGTMRQAPGGATLLLSCTAHLSTSGLSKLASRSYNARGKTSTWPVGNNGTKSATKPPGGVSPRLNSLPRRLPAARNVSPALHHPAHPPLCLVTAVEHRPGWTGRHRGKRTTDARG